MRKLSLVAVLFGLAALAGCAGVTKSPSEIWNTYAEVADMDARQMADDVNMILLADRQYRLTRWNLR